MNTVTLIDGRQVSSDSEHWRHECEARHIAALPTSEARHDYIAVVRKRRGDDAGAALQALAIAIYNANRAHKGGRA